jgi:hypothetical protein
MRARWISQGISKKGQNIEQKTKINLDVFLIFGHRGEFELSVRDKNELFRFLSEVL